MNSLPPTNNSYKQYRLPPSHILLPMAWRARYCCKLLQTSRTMYPHPIVRTSSQTKLSPHFYKGNLQFPIGSSFSFLLQPQRRKPLIDLAHLKPQPHTRRSTSSRTTHTQSITHHTPSRIPSSTTPSSLSQTKNTKTNHTTHLPFTFTMPQSTTTSHHTTSVTSIHTFTKSPHLHSTTPTTDLNTCTLPYRPKNRGTHGNRGRPPPGGCIVM